MLDKVTIIIPSHFLHDYLKRTLDYYVGSNVKIIVVDSTNHIFKEKDAYNIEYHHHPGWSYCANLLFAAQRVSTEYVVSCSHDDIILLEGLKRNIEFLENNPDYSSSQGAMLFYNTRYNRFNVLAYHDYSKLINVRAESSIERFEQQYEKYSHQAYTVTSTSQFLEFSEYCASRNIVDLGVWEFVQSGFYAIAGKSHREAYLYYVQDNLYNSAASIYRGYQCDERDEQNITDHRNARFILADYLLKHSALNEKESVRCVDRVLDDFMSRQGVSLRMKLKAKLKAALPSKLMEYKRVKEAQLLEKELCANLTEEEIKAFYELKKFIMNANVVDSTIRCAPGTDG